MFSGILTEFKTLNRLDSDQAGRFIYSDLGPNCLQGNQQTTLEDNELSKQSRDNSKFPL